jgi:membrane-associated phospholipid phosphatase
MQVRAQIVGRAALVSTQMESVPAWSPQQGTHLRVKTPQPGKPANLARWSPAVRAASIQQALQAGFHVEFDAATETAWGFHLDKPASLRAAGAAVRTVGVFSLRKPSEDDFAAQLALVFQAATDQRKDRFEEVLSQNEFPWPLWAAAVNLQPGRHRRSIELIGHALTFTAAVYHRVKHEMACIRPADRSPLIQPLLPTPEHGTLPSGHATESFMMATLLPALVRQKPDSMLGRYLSRLADQIAHNRVIAGLHFPVDSQAGRALGTALARYLVQRAGHAAAGGIAWSGVGVGASAFDATQPLVPMQQAAGAGAIGPDPLWKWLWDEAAAEFRQ